MPKLLCPRGHVIDLSPVPTPNEYFYVATTRWDEVVSTVVEALSQRATDSDIPLGETVSDALAGLGSYFYRCGICGSLVFPDEEPPLAYVPAQEAPEPVESGLPPRI